MPLQHTIFLSARRCAVFLAVTLLIFQLFSCKELFYATGKIRDMNEITLVSIAFNENSYSDTEVPVKFPDDRFFIQSFNESLVEVFNSNDKNVRLRTLSYQELQSLFENEALRDKSYTLYDDGLVLMDSRPTESDVKVIQALLQELSPLQANYSMVLVLNSAIWAQGIQGQMYVYGPKHEIAWNEKMEYSSLHIISDKASPHLMRNAYLFKKPDEASTWETELKKVAADLGKITAESFKESLNYMYRRLRP